MLWDLLNQVETQEHKYPNEIYKVPVKTNFFNHFIVTATLVNAVRCIYQHQNIEDNTAQYVTAVETGNGKEQVVELVR